MLLESSNTPNQTLQMPSNIRERTRTQFELIEKKLNHVPDSAFKT